MPLKILINKYSHEIVLTFFKFCAVSIIIIYYYEMSFEKKKTFDGNVGT